MQDHLAHRYFDTAHAILQPLSTTIPAGSGRYGAALAVAGAAHRVGLSAHQAGQPGDPRVGRTWPSAS